MSKRAKKKRSLMRRERAKWLASPRTRRRIAAKELDSLGIEFVMERLEDKPDGDKLKTLDRQIRRRYRILGVPGR